MDCRFEKEGEIKRKGSLINFFRIALFFGEIATLYQTEWRRSINTTLFLQNVIDLTGHTIRPMIFHLHRGGETLKRMPQKAEKISLLSLCSGDKR